MDQEDIKVYCISAERYKNKFLIFIDRPNQEPLFGYFILDWHLKENSKKISQSSLLKLAKTPGKYLSKLSTEKVYLMGGVYDDLKQYDLPENFSPIYHKKFNIE